jgi:hypothetical protein
MCFAQALSLSAVSGGDPAAAIRILEKDTSHGGNGASVCVGSAGEGALAAGKQPRTGASLAACTETPGAHTLGHELRRATRRRVF